MAAIYKETNKIPLVQIHDELAFSVEDQKEAEYLCKIMEEAVGLGVPTPCDISLGDTWGDLSKLDIKDNSRIIPEEDE